MYLKQAWAYMVRNDGMIFECEHNIHPYILKDRCLTADSLYFFQENTQNNKIKLLLQKEERTEEENTYIYEELNKEFCRIRTSALRGQYSFCSDTIYVRLSSDFSLWKDILINIATENHNHYKTITVVNDETIFHNFNPAKVNNQELIDIPIDDFILL